MGRGGGKGDRQPTVVRQTRLFQGRPESLYRIAASLAQAHRGWISLRPEVGDAESKSEDDVVTGLLSAMLTDRRHVVPLCSWVVGTVTRRGPRPDSLGIQHATGTKALERLAERGVALPKGWRSVQDHPRRGLVVEAPAGTEGPDQLWWLLRAGAALSERPVTGWWQAEVHGPPAALAAGGLT